MGRFDGWRTAGAGRVMSIWAEGKKGKPVRCVDSVGFLSFMLLTGRDKMNHPHNTITLSAWVVCYLLAQETESI